jgi:hypothetical protein
VQNKYNLSDRAHEDVLQYCENNGIAIVPWFPVAAGKAWRGAGCGGKKAWGDGEPTFIGLAAAALAGDFADSGDFICPASGRKPSGCGSNSERLRVGGD